MRLTIALSKYPYEFTYCKTRKTTNYSCKSCVFIKSQFFDNFMTFYLISLNSSYLKLRVTDHFIQFIPKLVIHYSAPKSTTTILNFSPSGISLN